jgi:membrane-bound lytic murein transglycosylase D
MMKKTLIILVLIYSCLSTSTTFARENFPVNGSMKKRVNFWIKVYTEVGSRESIAHDISDLSIIYKKINTPKNRRSKSRLLKKEKKNIRKTILSIARKNYVNLNKEESRIAKIIGEKTNKELKALAKNFRFQGGLKDRYLVGLKRSYTYLDYIRKTIKSHGLPEELAYLPHVESSFNYKAYSKVGAAGIWQFMRSTGRLYKLKINYVIDERRDPIKATNAAIRLLKDNYRILGRWPLALTAYNHGPRSIKRAIKEVGSKDINKIIENYKGRRFGFASKNFYATFMATVTISKKPYLYFPQFKKPAAFKYAQITLDKPYTVKQLTKTIKVSSKTIKEYNYDIRRSAYRSSLYLPKNYKLKLPHKLAKHVPIIQKNLKKLKFLKTEFNSERLHIVSRGENLFDIARVHRVKMANIIQFNQIMDPSKIYPGMKLKIPGKKNIKELRRKIKKKSKKVAKVNLKQGTKYKSESKSNSFFNSLTSSFQKTKVNDKSQKTYEKLAPIVNLTKYNLAITKISESLVSIVIENEETLGHYSDWARVKLAKLRKINNMSPRKNITRGQKIKISIPESKIHNFKLRRNEYHLSIQEDFYSNYIITGKIVYSVRRGDSLSGILRRNKLPFWLLRQYQEGDKFNDKLNIGQKLWIPQIESTDDSGLVDDLTNS